MKEYFSAVFLTVLMTIFILSVNALAYHPLITDDAGNVGKGKAEVELNFEYSSRKKDGVKE